MTAAEHPVMPEELMAYLDGELAADGAERVSRHLPGCAACQAIMRDLRAVSGDMARWDVAPPPSTLRPPSATLSSRERVPRGWWNARGWQLAAAAALVCIVAAIVVTSRSTPDGSPPGGERHPISIQMSGAPARSAEAVAVPEATSMRMAAGVVQAGAAADPLIARTASLTIVAREFDAVRPALERILAEVAGFPGRIDVSGARGEPRLLSATLRVPAERLEAAVTGLRGLGQVIAESQTGDDVTAQSVDLDARLANARNTETRLNEVLQRRTGDVADVLAAEREVARVRGEIEQMEAQRRMLTQRVTYATVDVTVREERKAALDLGPLPVGTQLRNAAVDGLRAASSSVVNAALFAARVAPVLLLWMLVLAWPARVVWRRVWHP